MKKHSERFLKLVNDSKNDITLCTINDIKAKIDKGEKFNLIDVREDNEWLKGSIPESIHMGKGIIERDIENVFPDTGTELFLYCGGGFRSALACESLKKMGYSNAVSVEGGYTAWLDAGYETKKEKS